MNKICTECDKTVNSLGFASHRAMHYRAREANGQYAFTGDMTRLCVCGHPLGVHAGENDTSKRPCFNADYDPVTDQGVPGATGEDCSCQHFRLSRKQIATHQTNVDKEA